MPDNDPFSMFNLPEQEQTETPTDEEAKKPSEVDELRTQLAAMQAAQNEERRRNTELMAQLFQGRQGQNLAAPAAPSLGIDLEGLPDPRDDLDGYHKGLGERLGRTLGDMRRQVESEITTRQTEAQRQEELQNSAWVAFQKDHEDLAKVPQLVQIGAAEVMGELRQKNIDPLFLMQNNLEDFVSRVAERTEALVTQVRGGDGADGAGRTRMLDGSGPRARGKPDTGAAKASDFVDGIKEYQKKHRIY